MKSVILKMFKLIVFVTLIIGVLYYFIGIGFGRAVVKSVIGIEKARKFYNQEEDTLSEKK